MSELLKYLAEFDSRHIGYLYIAGIASGTVLGIVYLAFKLVTVGPVRAIDETSTFVGKFFAWSIVCLTIAITYEVFARYVILKPTEWAYDVSYMLYGLLFMMAGAYTLARGGHVRGDFLYRTWAPKNQAMIDLILYFLFFFPGIIALIYSGWNFFIASYGFNERPSSSPNGPIIWPFKAIIPITGVLMFLQGVVEVWRCIVCLKTGEWPQRLHDVEELEKIVLEQAQASKQST